MPQTGSISGTGAGCNTTDALGGSGSSVALTKQ